MKVNFKVFSLGKELPVRICDEVLFDKSKHKLTIFFRFVAM